MAEPYSDNELPQARVTPGRRKRISVIWIIPILAAVVALGIAINRIMKEGPTITIEFREAQGIEAGKTFIKYKDVNIGQVSKIELSSDFSRVKVTAKITKDAEDLMTEDARFWVVEPRISMSGVSGLSTLLSGNYIGFAEGRSKKSGRSYVGLEVAPIVSGQPGREFLLTAAALGSFGVGSPVYFRRIAVGQVTSYELAPDGKAIQLKVFVNSPYEKYVNPETRFWNASGIDMSVGANGVDIRTESLVALLAGGVAFETPSYAKVDGPAAAGTGFTLYRDQATAMKQPEAIARKFVLYFDESLRGLSVEAPVLMLGLPAGEVTAVGLEVDLKADRPRGRVEIVAYPDRLITRLGGAGAADAADMARGKAVREAYFNRLVEQQGLRAQLRSGNLLTGERYVALDFFPDVPEAVIDWNLAEPVMPTIPSALPELEAKLGSIMTKLDSLPYKAIGENFNTTLETVNELLARWDKDLTPELKGALVDMRAAMTKADRLLDNANTNITGPDAPTQQALKDALDEVSRAARSFRDLTDYLERHPEALIRGKDEEKN
ncbi:MAG: MlaD family protein [Steroidobacteraceae bacterium]|nr:MlaD family protein [Steroidobacteraceae bacterium]